MNLNILKTFRDLVELGSFSRAAEVNFVSQSAVSQQISKLEKEWHVKLISRSGGIVEPTQAGRVFYESAGEILRQYDQMVTQIKIADQSTRGVLRVGMIYSVGFYLLAPCVAQFTEEHPEIDLQINYDHWNRISAAVIAGEMDLGIVSFPQRHRSLELLPLTEEPLVMICRPDHPLAGKEDISLHSVARENFVAFETSVPTRRLVDQQFKNRKTQPNVVMTFDNVELVKRAVMIGSGVSIVPRSAVHEELLRGDLGMAVIRGSRWKRTIGILRRRGRTHTPAETLFLEMLQSQF